MPYVKSAERKQHSVLKFSKFLHKRPEPNHQITEKSHFA